MAEAPEGPARLIRLLPKARKYIEKSIKISKDLGVAGARGGRAGVQPRSAATGGRDMSRAGGAFFVVVMIVAAALWGVSFVAERREMAEDAASKAVSAAATGGTTAAPATGAPTPAPQASSTEAPASSTAAAPASPGAAPAPAATTTASAVAPETPSAAGTAGGAPAPAADAAAGGSAGGAGELVKGDATFDVARIEPSGDAVLAGRTDPDTVVTLYANGTEVAKTTSNPTGDWVIVLSEPLKPGDYELSVKTGDSADTVESSSRLAVSIPEDPSEKPFIALVTPGVAAQVLQQPDADGSLPVSIATIAAAGGRIVVTGKAPANADVRVYFDDAPLAPTKADAAGAWKLEATLDVAPGSHAVRADAVGGDGTVSARAEVPFEMPNAEAAAAVPTTVETAGTAPAEPAAAAPAAEAETAAQAADGKPETGPKVVVVRRGDDLWSIAQRYLGDGDRFTAIYRANRTQIRNPDLIYPGQELVIP